ncbi:MAG: ROK family protein [Phycisphaeraceae bacterium]|nr:ROK family protein [Phycisphaeraceae bacterium]
MKTTAPSSDTLGIDIGGTSVKAVLMRDGHELARARSLPYSRPDHDTLAGAVAAAASGAAAGATPAHIGLCLPGLWCPLARTVTYSANVPGIVGMPLKDLLASLPFDSDRCTVVADAYAAAFDARCERPGAAPLAGRLFALSLGTGVGACVINEDGSPLRVSGDSPGHFGQIDVTLDDSLAPVGPDGGTGSLESYLGLPALRARYKVPDEQLCAAVSPADAPMRALARALRIAHAIYRPQHIRLLGGVGIRLGSLLAPLRARIEDGLTSLARPGWTLACGTSDLHAARGAARIAAQSSQTD